MAGNIITTPIETLSPVTLVTTSSIGSVTNFTVGGVSKITQLVNSPASTVTTVVSVYPGVQLTTPKEGWM